MPLLSIIKPLSRLFESDTKKDLVVKDAVKDSIWRDTGQVYYMTNTLKLSYETKFGPVTYENLSLESLPKLLKELNAPYNPLLQQKETAEQKDAFVISMCGVTWEENETSTRVKAITEAAMLRSVQSDFKKSQAVFKHEYFLEHNDVLNAPSLSNSNGVFTYANISIEEFVEQIEIANTHISAELKRRINVQPDNFKSLFSASEEQALGHVLNVPSDDNEPQH
jgi:hypothetical protein